MFVNFLILPLFFSDGVREIAEEGKYLDFINRRKGSPTSTVDLRLVFYFEK